LYREKFKKFSAGVQPGSTLAWKDEIQGLFELLFRIMLVVLIAGTSIASDSWHLGMSTHFPSVFYRGP